MHPIIGKYTLFGHIFEYLYDIKLTNGLYAFIKNFSCILYFWRISNDKFEDFSFNN